MTDSNVQDLSPHQNLPAAPTLQELSPDQDLPLQISQSEWETLVGVQCPLPPRQYKYGNDKKTSPFSNALYYKGKFWVKSEEDGKIYEAQISSNDLSKYQYRIKHVRAVDEYLSKFRLNSSADTYHILKSSIQNGIDQGEESLEDKKALALYQTFRIYWIDRLSFFWLIFRSCLNGYYIIRNLVEVELGDYYTIFVLVVNIVEALLWLSPLIKLLYNLYSLFKRILLNDTVHFQVRNIPEATKELAYVSILKYLPSSQNAVLAKNRRREWLYEIEGEYKFSLLNAEKCLMFVKLRVIIKTLLSIIAPILAVFSLIFKMYQLQFAVRDKISDWSYNEIIRYFAFVNQVASIRKVNEIEEQAIQHFIFSGRDSRLSLQEKMLIQSWWNFTLVSCVSNICRYFQYQVFDSIVLYHSLSTRKIELLFKKHGVEGEEFLSLNKSTVILSVKDDNYDVDVMEKTKRHADLSQVMSVLKTDN